MKPAWGYLGQTTLLTSAMKWITGPSGLKWKWSSTQRKEMTNSLGVCRSATAQYRDKFHRESNRSISQHKSTDISCIRLKLSTLICRQEYTSQHQITIFIKRFSSVWTNRCFYTDKRRDWAKVWSICWENFYPSVGPTRMSRDVVGLKKLCWIVSMFYCVHCILLW